ncbi:hypothetical protein EBB07_13095 [Paenibacillaceae bacterium]|nr:hypothetical protein EBB07_13095 [Paenibacillaceae bacterium]
MNRLVDSITALIHDTDYFAEIASKVDLRKYLFDEIDSFVYPVGVYYLSINKSYVDDYQQAYSILFLKSLYYEYDWNVEEPVHASITEEKWAEILKTIWIPKQHKKLHIKQYSSLELSNEAAVWLEHNKFPQEQIEQFRAQHSEANVIEVLDIYAGHHCFGETENVFFITEFGCGYD